MLANILRTGMHAHRPLPDDSDLAKAVAVLVRAQQDAVWSRQQTGNQIRSLLRECHPVALDAFLGKQGGLAWPEARAVLAAAPTPRVAARLTLPQLRAALKRCGRVRGIDAEAERIKTALRAKQAHQPTLVEGTMGAQPLALLGQLDAARQAVDDLARAVEASFSSTRTLRSCSAPGMGVQLGARVLAETGDDRERFADARALKACPARPITRASGKKRFVGRR